MSRLFIALLNVSLAASFVALAVMLVRLLLKRAPRVFSYALWAVVFFRLACPLAIEIPVRINPIAPRPFPRISSMPKTRLSTVGWPFSTAR